MTAARQPAGDLRAADAGRKVLLKGWVGRRRDLGDLIFLTVRDRSGTVQVLFDRVRCPVDAVASAAQARSEDVVEIEGEVALRAAGQANPDQKTGEIEVVASRLEFLARADTPPFTIEDRTNVAEDLRLEYRYLDLRRPSMLANFVLRDEIAFRVRRFLHERGFLEVETPLLTRSTPEGARDFLVPSRIHRGEWYALPQSPQIFKQILMVAGFEKYFQIARCFRDEDLRADRQPEFTQIDIEMSFPTEEDVFSVVEPMLADVFAAAGIACETPFPRLTYAEAMELYGTDRPDLRFGLPLTGLDAAAAGSGFAPFDAALNGGGTVRGLRVPGGATLSRKQLDLLGEEAKQHGAPALLWIKRAGGEVSSPAKKHLDPAALDRILSAASVEEGDLLLIVAASSKQAFSSLGAAPAGRPRSRPGGRVAIPVLLDHGLSSPRVGRRGRALVRDAPSLHVAARGGPPAPRERSRLREGAGVRRRPERHGARRRVDPDPPRRRPAPGLPGARDRRAGSARQVRIPSRRLPLRGASARRDRVRPRPNLRARGRGHVHPRRHRVPEDFLGARPHGEGAVARRPDQLRELGLAPPPAARDE